MFFYVKYDKNTGDITQSLSMPEIAVPLTQLKDNELLLKVSGIINTAKYRVKDGVVIAKTEQDMDSPPIEDLQAQVWRGIKDRRFGAITSGVYINSIDKWFHTDEISATTYSTIAGMIALDNYEPIQWKTMDNEWVLLTIPLFKELQTAMSLKTNENYVVAEMHKDAMLQTENPLEYNYSTDWV